MPLMRCTVTEDGKTKQGWKYSESGKCWIGPGAKKKAIKQGLAIQYHGGEKFKAEQMLTKQSLEPEINLDDPYWERLADTLISRREELADDVQRLLLDKK